jgi:hypothetical protein
LQAAYLERLLRGAGIPEVLRGAEEARGASGDAIIAPSPAESLSIGDVLGASDRQTDQRPGPLPDADGPPQVRLSAALSISPESSQVRPPAP